MASSAWAGPALDDASAQPSAAATDPSVAANPPPDPANTIEYGVGIRLRNVRVPQSILELFIERTAGGASNVGLGVELIRRRGTVELQLGLEFEHLEVGEGVWINKDEPVPANEADYVLSPDHAGESPLGWFTVDFTFLNHAEINKYLSFRYGGGAGIGFITSGLYHYNIQCAPGTTNSNPEPGCVPPRFNGSGQYSEGSEVRAEYTSIPPVFPVINAIIGLQVKPIDKLTVNFEAGIRTLPFFGMSAAYFF